MARRRGSGTAGGGGGTAASPRSGRGGGGSAAAAAAVGYSAPTAKSPAAPDFSVILPVYNEADNLPLMMEMIERAFAGLGASYQVVIVEDKSPDGTRDVAREMEALFGADKVTLLLREGKMGLGTAYVDALRLTRADRIFIMDADLSHNVRGATSCDVVRSRRGARRPQRSASVAVASRVWRVASIATRRWRRRRLPTTAASRWHRSRPVPRSLTRAPSLARSRMQPASFKDFIATRDREACDVVTGTR